MKLSIAYGLPACGKTHLLKSLKGKYYDFDKNTNRYQIKKVIKQLKEGDYILDFMIFQPNKFINFFKSIHPLAEIDIYVFKKDINVSIQRDKERDRNKSSIELINNMKLYTIEDRTNLNIIEV